MTCCPPAHQRRRHFATVIVVDYHYSIQTTFSRRQAIKTGKSLLLQQRRHNSSGSTADNGPFTITIPKIGVAVGTAALAFQIIVLDPWHHDLTKQVNELQTCVVEVNKANKNLSSALEQLQKKP